MVRLESLEILSEERLQTWLKHKFLTGRYKTNPSDLLSMPLRNLRDRLSLKLFKPAVIKEVPRNFFANIDEWNSLPEKKLLELILQKRSQIKKLRAVPLGIDE